mmetsp:Transcript_15519/g.45803  ORF Transcript_15519/g.45803 Transcript_15519/m.45803 type:complete len:248 (+) Transcript_15519:369-1112(+)
MRLAARVHRRAVRSRKPAVDGLDLEADSTIGALAVLEDDEVGPPIAHLFVGKQRSICHHAHLSTVALQCRHEARLRNSREYVLLRTHDRKLGDSHLARACVRVHCLAHLKRLVRAAVLVELPHVKVRFLSEVAVGDDGHVRIAAADALRDTLKVCRIVWTQAVLVADRHVPEHKRLAAPHARTHGSPLRGRRPQQKLERVECVVVPRCSRARDHRLRLADACVDHPHGLRRQRLAQLHEFKRSERVA